MEEEIKSLDVSLVKKGLRTLGKNPLTLQHCFLELSLHSKSLTDVNALSDYMGVVYLDISKNFIVDISVLSNLPSLVQLNASENKISKCLDFCAPHCRENDAWAEGHKAVGSMLTLADLSKNEIDCIGDLSRHRFLECLLLGSNKIPKIEGLSTLRYLKVLDLSDNSIEKLEGLAGLPVRELKLRGNKLSDLTGMDGLPELSALDVSGNRVRSLSALAECKRLTYLDVSNNEVDYIRQTEFLVAIPWLKVLLLQGNPCFKKEHYRLRVLYRLRHLERLDMVNVSHEEQIVAMNLHQSEEGGDWVQRQMVFARHLPHEEFMDFGPRLVFDDERELTDEDLIEIKCIHPTAEEQEEGALDPIDPESSPILTAED